MDEPLDGDGICHKAFDAELSTCESAALSVDGFIQACALKIQARVRGTVQ